MSLSGSEPFLPLFVPIEATAPRPSAAPHGPVTVSDEEFEAFWQAWPRERRIDKADTRRRYALARRFASAATILQGAVNYAAVCAIRGTERQFIKHPSTFLNKGSWENDYPELQGNLTDGTVAGSPGAKPNRSRADTILAAGFAAASRFRDQVDPDPTGAGRRLRAARAAGLDAADD